MPNIMPNIMPQTELNEAKKACTVFSRPSETNR